MIGCPTTLYVFVLAFARLNALPTNLVNADNDGWKCSAKHEVRSWGSNVISSIDELSSPSTVKQYGGRYKYKEIVADSSGGKSGDASVSAGLSKNDGKSKSSKTTATEGKGGKSNAKSNGGRGIKSASVSVGGGSAGRGISPPWSRGRRLDRSWAAAFDLSESPDIVWVGSSNFSPHLSKNGSGEKHSKSSKIKSIGKNTRSDAQAQQRGSWSNSNGDKTDRYAVSSWSSPSRSNAPSICRSSEGNEPPTSTPSTLESPTMFPTSAPTTCDDRLSLWYFNIIDGRCVTGYSASDMLGENEHYESLSKCCEERYPEKIEYCEEYLYEDRCCSMNHLEWYFNPNFEVCTNDDNNNSPVTDGSVEYYGRVVDCCIGEFKQYPCPKRDICIPDEPTLEPTSSPSKAPSTEAPTTPEPTIAEPSSYPSTMEPELTTVEPTSFPTGVPSPSTEVPTTPEPTSLGPTNSPSAAPSTERPTTIEPTNSPSAAPSTEPPTTDEPTNSPSAAPSTEPPTTDEPTNSPSVAPSTERPTTIEPTNSPSAAPSTKHPTTMYPTNSPSSAPSTEAPTTLMPSSWVPTSIEPSSSNPTTLTPSTVELVTMVPTTDLPSTLEPTTTEPTLSKILTIEPSLAPQSMSGIILTFTPTFGSTPTISKETTGPPTMNRTHSTHQNRIVSNDFKKFSQTQDVNTDCVEHYDKVWSAKSKSMIEVCVFVCTVNTTIYEGDGSFNSNIKTINSECPTSSETLGGDS